MFLVALMKINKEYYMPKNKPEIVTLPPANYIAVRGTGDPNEEGALTSRRSAFCTQLPIP